MTHKLLPLHLKAFFIQQIAARWNSLDDKSDYIEKEENDRRRYFLEKTTNSLNSIFKSASAPSDTSENHSSDTDLSTKSDSSQQLLVASREDLEILSEIEIPRTPRNTAMPVMAEDSLDDVISDEESTICDERPKLSDYTIPTSIDTEAIFATISDYSKMSVEKIKKSLTSLRKRNSPTTSSLQTSRSTSELDCRNLESSNDDPDRMKYLIFMFTIRWVFNLMHRFLIGAQASFILIG